MTVEEFQGYLVVKASPGMELVRKALPWSRHPVLILRPRDLPLYEERPRGNP